MFKITQKNQKIISILLKNGKMQSSGVHAELAKIDDNISLVTVKRALVELAKDGFLNIEGAGRSTGYSISTTGRVFSDVDARKYCSIEPDQRYGLRKYNLDLMSVFSNDIFTNNELDILQAATKEFERRTADVPTAIQKKEFERLVIELSWKSSKIEGNTYTLLDTEKLILENKEAEGHNKQEAIMILNHKYAFDYIHKNATKFNNLTKRNLEDLHAILVKDLNVGFGLRSKPVGVIGSIYQPLDNIHQIDEAVEKLADVISKNKNAYAKALLALLGISYIQPFEDGNKRTARLMCNAILMAYSFSPLSYRSVNEQDYREAILVFYELNSIMSMKKIFVIQYDFAARNYAVK